MLKLYAVVLLICTSTSVWATAYIHQAVGIYGTSYTTNNTWTETGTANTGGTCTTTALSSKITVSLTKGYIGADAMTVYGKTNLKVQCTTGYKVYRVVFSPASGNSSPNTAAGHLSCNGSGSISQNTWWSSSDEGNNSITFTGTDADDNFKITHLNIYIRYEATSAQATLSPTSVTVNAQDVQTKSFSLTTNMGSFPGGSYFQNKVYTDASTSDIDFDDYNVYGTISSGSSISTTIYGYNVGTYDAYFILGQTEVGSNNNKNYSAVGIELPFTITVVDACANQTEVKFAHPAGYDLKVGASNFTNAATAYIKNTNTATGQAVTYTSDNPSVASVNASTGAITLGSTVGTATITASVESDGQTYCDSENSYTITLSKYTVTYHYPTCAASQPEDEENVSGSLSLPTNMEVDGYRFAGWTTAAVTTNPSSVSPLYTSSVTVSSDMDLYAVYTKTSSTFTLVDKGTTTPEAGEYVIVSSYSSGSTKVLTADIDNKYKIAANTSDYTITAVKTLSCQEEACIWTIAAVSGGFTIRNNSTGKYLGAASGASGSSDQKLRLETSTGDYTTWTLTRESTKVPFTTINNKRNTDGETTKNLMCSGNYYAFYSSGTSPYLFKRASSSGTYTSNPDCNATEYKVTIQQQDGGTVTASASANGTWSDPVLNGMHGGETITITATPDSYHDFASWTVVSGGVSVSPSDDSPATFTMPANDVVIRPNYTARSYDITYKDKGNNTFSGDAIASSYNSYTYGVGLTLPEPTKDDYVFMGWYAETDCSGSRVTTISTTDNGNKTFYALWMTYDDPLAWCPEPEVHLTGDNVFITSTNGKSIMAVNTLTLNAINLVPGSTVRLSTPAGSGIMFSASGVKYNATTATLDITASDPGGTITDVPIYVHYYPTSAGTGAPADITVTATYQTNTDYYSTQDVHVRNMPSAFAIATKVGGSWYALKANMSGATNPAGVLLNVDESSWTAQGPSTLAYELWPVKSTTGSADLYATKGEKVRFSGNSNKGLWASTSTNTLNNNAGISALDATPEDNYEWNITTAVDGSTWKYTMKMEGQSYFLRYYNSSQWGSYSGDAADVYFIPLTIVEDATMSVMEWGESEIAVKCAANTTLSKVTIDGTEVSPKPSLTSLGGDIYKITGGGMPNLSTLATYAMKSMVIEVSESSTDKQCILTIPFILTSTNSPAATPLTAIALRNYAGDGSQDAKNLATSVVDVVIRNGAQLDVTTEVGNATACKFNDLYIYPGGKMHINTNDINLSNVYLRGGFSWLDASKDYRLPQMLVENGKKIQGVGTAGNGVYYDLYLDNSRYYMMCVPKDVKLDSITNEENGADGTVWIKEYNGKNRTKTPKEKGWVYISTASLLRGVGYEMAIKPRVTGRTIGIMRMPLLKSTTAWTDEAACTPSVTAWGIDTEGVTDNNKGWNFIGSPFFSSFRNTDANGQFGTNMEIKSLDSTKVNGQWTGTWDWTTSDVKYITIPQKMYDDYTDVRSKNYEIEAFYPFFIQAKTSGTLSFTSGSKILKAPALMRATVPMREVDIDFVLTDANGTSDNAGLTVGDDYSADFDMDDKEKTIVNENYLKVYTMVGEYRTAFNSLPEAAAALPIPVGYIAPKEGEYTFSLDERNKLTEVDHVYLTDYKTNLTVDLIDKDYVFRTEQGQNDVRFALNIILKPEPVDPITTGVDALDVDDDEPIKFIYQDKMYIRHNGVIYDATGKRVREINK